MAELKTQKNDRPVEAFLATVADEKKRNDCFALIKMMQQATGKPPKMWGTSIVGFGSYYYKNKSGQGTDWFLTGFSPRKQNLSLYIMPGIELYKELLKKLGKYKTGVSCLYINKLEDIDITVLQQIIAESIKRFGKSA